MKILVINSGSSSIKYELFDMARETKLASGQAEKIGQDNGSITYGRIADDGQRTEKKEDRVMANHQEALTYIVRFLMDKQHGAVHNHNEITAVGHRIVHGGETFKETTVITKDVLATIKKFIPLAPLHNPANLLGIEVALSIFPDSVQVAVFDTAFHQTIPKEAYLYALPIELYEKYGVRRYGFHGTSHAYVSQQAALFLNRPLDGLNLITIHLGNGCSMAAIRAGQCVDTSMGMTPLEGLVMGTRSGDIDPAIPFFLSDHLEMPFNKIDTLLNKESGLNGLCGTNDMREVLDKINQGDKESDTAVDVYTYRIKKYIGAYLAVLGKADAIVFTAGIGENAPVIRERSCRDLEALGIVVNPERNQQSQNISRMISPDNTKVKVLVIPTNEELRIAQEVKKLVIK